MKSRIFNVLYHAKDAYLNIVTGNVYNEKFTKYKGFNIHSDYSIKIRTIFTHDFIRGDEVIWKADKMLDYDLYIHKPECLIYRKRLNNPQFVGCFSDFDQNWIVEFEV